MAVALAMTAGGGCAGPGRRIERVNGARRIRMVSGGGLMMP